MSDKETIAVGEWPDVIDMATNTLAKRLAKGKDDILKDVIWCMDEKSNEGQRVNVRMETENLVKN